MEIDFLVYILGWMNLSAAAALGPDWWKEAVRRTYQCVGMLLSLPLLTAPVTPMLRWETCASGAGSFSAEAKPPAQSCWPGGTPRPWLPRDRRGDLVTAFLSVCTQPSPYHLLLSGIWCLSSVEILQGSVEWISLSSSSWVSASSSVQSSSAGILLPARHPHSKLLPRPVPVPFLDKYVCSVLNFLESVFKVTTFSEIVGLLIWGSWHFFSCNFDYITGLFHQQILSSESRVNFRAKVNTQPKF